MNKTAFSRNNGFWILSAMLLFAAAERIHPGEPLIFRDSNDGSSAPKEKFDLNAIRPNSPSFDKKSSSVVEGVMSPWRHPTAKSGQKLTSQQRKRLLDALDRKKNWGLQDSDRLPDSESPSANEGELDAGQTRRNYNRAEESSLEKYSANRNAKKRTEDWKNSPFNNFDNSVDDPADQTDNEEELSLIDSFATAEDFEMRLDSIFDQPQPNEGMESPFNSADDFLEFNEFQTPTEDGELNGLFSNNVEPDAQIQFSQPSQSFNPLFSPPSALQSGVAGQQLIHRSGLNLQNSGIATPSAANLFGNSGIFSNPTAELPAANNPAIPSTSAIQSSGSPLGNSSLVQPGELELLNRPAANNILKQPAIFQLPKRSF